MLQGWIVFKDDKIVRDETTFDGENSETQTIKVENQNNDTQSNKEPVGEMPADKETAVNNVTTEVIEKADQSHENLQEANDSEEKSQKANGSNEETQKVGEGIEKTENANESTEKIEKENESDKKFLNVV